MDPATPVAKPAAPGMLEQLVDALVGEDAKSPPAAAAPVAPAGPAPAATPTPAAAAGPDRSTVAFYAQRAVEIDGLRFAAGDLVATLDAPSGVGVARVVAAIHAGALGADRPTEGEHVAR